jgi:hypothetical protein
MTALNKETLLQLGFTDLAAWKAVGEKIAWVLDNARAAANAPLLDQPNALYALALGEEVKYIGKTTQSVRTRFAGYKNPGKGQRTNLRCNQRIKEALRTGAEVRILVFIPISDLRYANFDINLAAGLEDSLIEAFDPPWNGRYKGKPVTEEAEREIAEEPETAPAAGAPAIQPAAMLASAREPLASFEIVLSPTYYRQGIINPGIDASRHLGVDGDFVEVVFDDATLPILSKIDRKASANGSVRIVGKNRQIAQWFQRRFREDDVCRAQILSPNRIKLIASRGAGSPVAQRP